MPLKPFGATGVAVVILVFAIQVCIGVAQAWLLSEVLVQAWTRTVALGSYVVFRMWLVYVVHVSASDRVESAPDRVELPGPQVFKSNVKRVCTLVQTREWASERTMYLWYSTPGD